MILVDSSVWIDHLRRGEPDLSALLAAGQILSHPCVTGEILLGNLSQRALIEQSLLALPRAEVASDDEVLRFIGAQRLFGRGIGYIDCQLLASARLTPDAALWTRDKRLRVAAAELGLAAKWK